MVFIHCSALEILHNYCTNAFRRDVTQFPDTEVVFFSVVLLFVMQRVSSSALYFHCEHEKSVISRNYKEKDISH